MFVGVFVQEKRDAFPRFYFLSNDDLLELLGQASKDILVIQKHIKKLIPGCQELGVDIESTPFTIKSLYTAEGDVLKLSQSIQMAGPIEVRIYACSVACWLVAYGTSKVKEIGSFYTICCCCYFRCG